MEDGRERLSCSARNGGDLGSPFDLSNGVGSDRGRKLRTAVAGRRSRRSRSSIRHVKSRPRWPRPVFRPMDLAMRPSVIAEIYHPTITPLPLPALSRSPSEAYRFRPDAPPLASSHRSWATCGLMWRSSGQRFPTMARSAHGIDTVDHPAPCSGPCDPSQPERRCIHVVLKPTRAMPDR